MILLIILAVSCTIAYEIFARMYIKHYETVKKVKVSSLQNSLLRIFSVIVSALLAFVIGIVALAIDWVFNIYHNISEIFMVILLMYNVYIIILIKDFQDKIKKLIDK